MPTPTGITTSEVWQWIWTNAWVIAVRVRHNPTFHMPVAPFILSLCAKTDSFDDAQYRALESNDITLYR